MYLVVFLGYIVRVGGVAVGISVFDRLFLSFFIIFGVLFIL